MKELGGKMCYYYVQFFFATGMFGYELIFVK